MVFPKIMTGLILVVAGVSNASTQLIAQQPPSAPPLWNQNSSSRKVLATTSNGVSNHRTGSRAVFTDQSQPIARPQPVKPTSTASQWTRLNDASNPAISTRRNTELTERVTSQPMDRSKEPMDSVKPVVNFQQGIPQQDIAQTQPVHHHFGETAQRSIPYVDPSQFSDVMVSSFIDQPPLNRKTTHPVVSDFPIKDVSTVDFSNVQSVDPQKVLKDGSIKFADPSKFLADSTNDANGRVSEFQQGVPSQRVSIRKTLGQSQDGTSVGQGQSAEAKRTPTLAQDQEMGAENDRQYLTVSDVNAPISPNPFQDLQQIDRSGIIQQTPQIQRAFVPANTYPELSGQNFQDHFASWTAHQFQHKPLYFEEVNLERYGNELRHQNVMSAAHFFTSAVLLPYKMGQTPPRTCISTLGRRRPGECVPYQIHKAPVSKRGLLTEGLIITALSL